MQIKPHQLQSFRELYKRKFDIDITNSQAQQKAHSVLTYLILCLKPTKSKEKTPE